MRKTSLRITSGTLCIQRILIKKERRKRKESSEKREIEREIRGGWLPRYVFTELFVSPARPSPPLSFSFLSSSSPSLPSFFSCLFVGLPNCTQRNRGFPRKEIGGGRFRWKGIGGTERNFIHDFPRVPEAKHFWQCALIEAHGHRPAAWYLADKVAQSCVHYEIQRTKGRERDTECSQVGITSQQTLNLLPRSSLFSLPDLSPSSPELHPRARNASRRRSLSLLLVLLSHPPFVPGRG